MNVADTGRFQGKIANRYTHIFRIGPALSNAEEADHRIDLLSDLEARDIMAQFNDHAGNVGPENDRKIHLRLPFLREGPVASRRYQSGGLMPIA